MTYLIRMAFSIIIAITAHSYSLGIHSTAFTWLWALLFAAINVAYSLIRFFDGYNDGLVGEKSFAWGEHYRFINPDSKRGVSHGDMIDLNRENFDGFDVREFYVQLVHELKEKGF